ILDAVNRGLKSAGHPSIGPQNQPDHSNLFREIVNMKRLLSKKDSHTIKLPTANCMIDFPCSRSNFEGFVSGELDRAFSCL
ncbi:MAG TPA: hypothetical protein PLA50_03840, partial [Bacteroidia bacterium]|nr:hypothetical protein [Bacteroidia bacterium]